jgi:hypothetical protein
MSKTWQVVISVVVAVAGVLDSIFNKGRSKGHGK